MKTKLLMSFLLCWSTSFGQSVPNNTSFSFFDVATAVYGDHNSGRNLVSAFADATSVRFDPAYGSKTMSPKTMLGFRNYEAVYAPVLTTTTVIEVSPTSISTGGNITDDGRSAITTRGVCWATHTAPTLDDYYQGAGTGSGSFSSTVTGLTTGTTYFLRAFAYNGTYMSYGNEYEFTLITYGGYGKLYNWYAATDAKNIAASGWHVPTIAEWIALRTYLSYNDACYLTEAGTLRWLSGSLSSCATNSTGFTMRPSGGRDTDGSYGALTAVGRFYLSDANDPGYSWIVDFSTSYTQTTYTNNYVRMGFAVRLIKDNSTDTGSYTDNSGNVYSTVKINNQVWITSNLRDTKYRDGTDIPQVTGTSAWAALTTGAWCWYNNNPFYE